MNLQPVKVVYSFKDNLLTSRLFVTGFILLTMLRWQFKHWDGPFGALSMALGRCLPRAVFDWLMSCLARRMDGSNSLVLLICAMGGRATTVSLSIGLLSTADVLRYV